MGCCLQLSLGSLVVIFLNVRVEAQAATAADKAATINHLKTDDCRDDPLAITC